MDTVSRQSFNYFHVPRNRLISKCVNYLGQSSVSTHFLFHELNSPWVKDCNLFYTGVGRGVALGQISQCLHIFCLQKSSSKAANCSQKSQKSPVKWNNHIFRLSGIQRNLPGTHFFCMPLWQLSTRNLDSVVVGKSSVPELWILSHIEF